MKQINFITTLSAKDQYALHKWIHLSIYCSIPLILIISGIQIHQLVRLYHATKQKTALPVQHAEYETVMSRKEQYEKEKNNLIKNLGTLTQLKTEAHSPLEHLKAVYGICKTPLAIETVSISGDAIELTAHCPSAQSAIHVVQTLNNSPLFKAVKLTSLQPAAQRANGLLSHRFIFTLSGKIK